MRLVFRTWPQRQEVEDKGPEEVAPDGDHRRKSISVSTSRRGSVDHGSSAKILQLENSLESATAEIERLKTEVNNITKEKMILDVKVHSMEDQRNDFETKARAFYEEVQSQAFLNSVLEQKNDELQCQISSDRLNKNELLQSKTRKLKDVIEKLTEEKKLYEDKEDEQSKRQLEKLEQKYTLGDVNFDSVIIIDFGNNLKSVLTSLVYTDVNQDKVLFTTINQWFDESIFYENSVKSLYYPSINFDNFKKHNNKYYKTFQLYPNEITILAYDALGLIYYVWNKNKGINSINDFFLKEKIKGKIGNFNFNDKKVTQELKIYKAENKKFKEF